ncbi:tyrosine-type recombinase/integrase [Azospirillum brasilense]|nr:tyrosine-type recombinase/integrase [Azospirillum brasilense]
MQVATPPVKSTLAERILDEAAVHRLLALEPTPRNAVLLRLLYAAGLRVSELCGLTWRDAQPRDGAGQLTVFGKGGKTRVVLLSAGTWAALQGLRGTAGVDAPLFRSRKGGPPGPTPVGPGGDSHPRFPIGISFPAGSGLVAFAAATGVMPLDMPESVLVRFKGTLQPGVTLRDLVNAIPLYAIRQGLLTVEKKGKKNIFSGRILEIEGLPELKVEQAFELSDASAERSAAACTVRLNKEPIIEYMRSNITLMKWMIANGYEDARTLGRRIKAMEDWIANPSLLEPDADAEYAAVIEIDLADIKEPIVACPNDPDDVKLLSEVAGDKIDEVFIGSCMTNIGHFRAAGKILDGKTDIPTRLWIAPPTKMDAQILTEEGYYGVLGKSGARMEMPGCSLCMGNQAQIRKGSTAISTSTRNFPNRLGIDTRVYLGSAELSAVAALLGKLPTPAEYLEQVSVINQKAGDIYRYMNFDQIKEFQDVADTVAA